MYSGQQQAPEVRSGIGPSALRQRIGHARQRDHDVPQPAPIAGRQALAVIERASRNTRLLIRSVADIGPDYARTLREWRMRFIAQLDLVRRQGFDDRFVRIWEYYLALSEAGFATGITQDLQIGFEKGRGIA